MKDKNGYTLIEALAVIAAISIVMTLAITISVRILDKAKSEVNEFNSKELIDAAIVYGEDLDKDNKSYFLLSDMTLSGGTIIRSGAEVNGYALKELINANHTLPVKTLYLYEKGYLESKEKQKKIDCTINLEFETSIQDGYIVIDKINAKLGEDCK